MTVGVMVMAYGTPATPADVEAYYTHIRRGRPPMPDQLADLRARYDALGGTSELAERTAAQTTAITTHLESRHPGQFVVQLGQKHAAPFIEDGVEVLAAAGVVAVAGVVLAPHYSAGSVGQYHARAAAVASARGVAYRGVERWDDLDAFVAHQSASLRSVLTSMPARTKVVFTAHSLPERVLTGDPYPAQLEQSAARIARAAGLGPWTDWGIGWQSAGRTPEPWRGPDILTVIGDLADTGRADGIVVVPHGFTADHLEVRYDLDIEAAAAAARVGLAFARTEVVNADPRVMGALADRVATLADVAVRT